jgi:hypothetical protein
VLVRGCMMRIRGKVLFLVIAFSFTVFFSAGGGQPPNTLRFYFIHLSCGENLLANDNGGLRKALSKAVTPEGRRFKVFDSSTGNTDQREWVARFNDWDDWKNYNIVAFKSCFPASDIDSNKMLKEYKKVYRKPLAKIFRDNPGILFVIVTAPPLVPNNTDQANADRARAFNNWLKGAFLKKYNRSNPEHDNVMVFDFFDVLADDHNMLKAEYRLDQWDSHPNKQGNKKATEVFVPLLEAATDLWADSR